MTEDKFVDPNITSDDKLWGLLSYVIGAIGPIIILFMEDKRNSPFLKAHYPQSLAFTIVVIIVAGIVGIITLGIGSICVGLLAWIPQIIWGIKAYNGEYVTIPVITDFVKKQGWAD